MAADTEQLKSAILKAGKVDYLDLWFISRLARSELGDRPADQLREIILAALESLLEDGLIRAGELVPPGEFAPWGLSADESAERVKSRLGAITRELQVGDVAWFEIAA